MKAAEWHEKNFTFKYYNRYAQPQNDLKVRPEASKFTPLYH